MSDCNIVTTKSPQTFVPPHPGSQAMPRWDAGELPDAPQLTLRSWALLLGPGLVAAGAAIGGGEWLAGPLTTARYGGAILWLVDASRSSRRSSTTSRSAATRSTAASRFSPASSACCPGPLFWLVVYLFLDFGSVFPYLVANAATPLGAVILGEIPDVDKIVRRASAST